MGERCCRCARCARRAWAKSCASQVSATERTTPALPRPRIPLPRLPSPPLPSPSPARQAPTGWTRPSASASAWPRTPRTSSTGRRCRHAAAHAVLCTLARCARCAPVPVPAHPCPPLTRSAPPSPCSCRRSASTRRARRAPSCPRCPPCRREEQRLRCRCRCACRQAAGPSSNCRVLTCAAPCAPPLPPLPTGRSAGLPVLQHAPPDGAVREGQQPRGAQARDRAGEINECRAHPAWAATGQHARPAAGEPRGRHQVAQLTRPRPPSRFPLLCSARPRRGSRARARRSSRCAVAVAASVGVHAVHAHVPAYCLAPLFCHQPQPFSPNPAQRSPTTTARPRCWPPRRTTRSR